MDNWAQPVEGGMRIRLLVQPRASRARFGPVHGDRIKVSITSPPVDGAANQAVIELLAKTMSVPKRAITITAGQTSRRKTVYVLGVDETSVEQALQ